MDILKNINPEIYFEKGPDERDVAFERFNFGIKVKKFFSEEIPRITKEVMGLE